MKIKMLLCGIFICCIIFQTFAQIGDARIDSLLIFAKRVTSVDSSNKIVDKVISESIAKNYKLGVVDGILLKGNNLYDSDRLDEVLKLLTTWKKTILSTNDNVRIAKLYALKANSYNSLFFTEKSKHSLIEAKRYAEKIVDDNSRYKHLSKVYMIMSNTFEVNKDVRLNLDSILYYRKMAYAIQQKIIGGGTLKTSAVIQGSAIGDIYLKVDKIDSAEYYFQKSLQLAKYHHLEKFTFQANMGLGQIHQLQNRPDSSIIYYDKALLVAQKIGNFRNIKDCYKELSIVYNTLGNTQKSVMYLKKYSLITDSLVQLGKKAVKTSSNIIIEEEERAHESKKSTYMLIIIGVVALLLLLSYLLYRFYRYHHRSVEKHKAEQEKLYQNLSEFKANAIADKINDKGLREVISLAMANDPIFFMKFKELHPAFIQKLMELAPTLATSDLIICAQLRLGFYTKEIARYNDVSVRAVEGKKHRIRKKLNIPATEDINVWMIKL